MSFYDSLEAGSQVDSYRIDAPIARSGMASIYRAIDVRDNRIVALKIPHPDMEADPILSDRFNREGRHRRKAEPSQRDARFWRRQALPRVHGHGVVPLAACCARSWMRKRLPHDRAIRIAEGVLEALDYIHANGVVPSRT